MSAEYVADAVVGVPYGGEGKKRWLKVGAVMKNDKNDNTRGMPFYLLLDKTFNPAGVYDDKSSVMVSFYWPSETKKAVAENKPAPATKSYNAPKPGWPADLDEDIPF